MPKLQNVTMAIINDNWNNTFDDKLNITVYVVKIVDSINAREVGGYIWHSSDNASSHRTFKDIEECKKDARDYLAYTYIDVKRSNVRFNDINVEAEV